MAIRLARAGYWGGDPRKVLEARVDLVVAAMEYEMFQHEYEMKWRDLNTEAR